MTRTLLSGIAAALLSLLASAPASAGDRGWGCHTCGFKNSTQLTGHVARPPSIAAAGTVTLPSGEVLVLR